MSIQIQAGKRYVKRNGEISGVIEDHDHEEYPFIDSENERSYAADGYYYHREKEDEDDLVSEYPEPSAEPSSLVQNVSLRDYFAGQALQGMFSNPALIDTFSHHQMMASESYMVADAMLAARNGKESA